MKTQIIEKGLWAPVVKGRILLNYMRRTRRQSMNDYISSLTLAQYAQYHLGNAAFRKVYVATVEDE